MKIYNDGEAVSRHEAMELLERHGVSHAIDMKRNAPVEVSKAIIDQAERIVVSACGAFPVLMADQVSIVLAGKAVSRCQIERTGTDHFFSCWVEA